MSAEDFIALLPLLAVSAGSVLVMLLAACRPCRALAPFVALGTLVLALVLIAAAGQVEPRQVTPLLIIDGYALLYQGAVLVAGLVSGLLAAGYLAARRPAGGADPRGEFFILLPLGTLGGMVLAAASHFASFVLGLELISISLFALVAYPLDIRSVEAGIKYLVLAGVSSAMLLFGLALLYARTGTMAFAALPAAVASLPSPSDPLILAATALVLSGLAFKLSLVPFHMWTPDVYQGAPAPVSAFIATASKAAVFALLLRYVGEGEIYRYSGLMLGLGAVAVASMLVGNLLALLQRNVKRILGYSSVAHLGYLLVALIAGSGWGPEAVGVYLAAYIITMLGAFGAVSVLSPGEEGRDLEGLEEYRGLFWRRPLVAGIFTLMLLSLAGIPLTAGFVGKFYLFAAGVGGALWWLLAALIIGSALGLYYYLRVVVTLFRVPESGWAAEEAPRAGQAMGMTVLVLLGVALVAFGVYPQPVIELVRMSVG
jgi:NADH-quinone oxidoreductase subunit N